MASQQFYYSPIDPAELNKAALEDFCYTPVRNHMIEYIARAARDVIRCDATMMPAPPQSIPAHHDSRVPATPPRTPPPVASGDKFLPSLEQFIINLVRQSNVQVPTLMSTLVYLNRLKSRLQPEAKGLRCTAHRIFLAALIITAKYLNDSSPKNKHWTRYTRVWDEARGPRTFYRGGRQTERQPDFQFSNTEVNLMEKQLLLLLEWDLSITQDDLYRHLDPFLEPIRQKIIARHERKAAAAAAAAAEEAARRAAEQEQQRMLTELWAASSSSSTSSATTSTANLSYNTYATPPTTPGSRSRSRGSSRHMRNATPDSIPGSSHSYAPSLASSGATTPPSSSSMTGDEPYVYNSSYDPPVEIIVAAQQLNLPSYYDAPLPQVPALVKQKSLLPYEISPDELREMETGVIGAKRSRVRGMFGRIFSSGGVPAR